MLRKLKKQHFNFIHKLLKSHKKQGQTALNPHVPENLRLFVHERTVMSRDIAKMYCQTHHVHKSMVRMCEAKVFIEMNPDIIEGLLVGNWADTIKNIKEETS